VLLHSDYMQVPNLFRTEADAHEYFPLMILAHVILSGALVWIYARGAEAKQALLPQPSGIATIVRTADRTFSAKVLRKLLTMLA
jgi:hypothetical protein